MARVSSRSTVKRAEDRQAADRERRAAATTLPKMITSRISSTGNEIDSALAMLRADLAVNGDLGGRGAADLGGDAVPAARPAGKSLLIAL